MITFEVDDLKKMNELLGSFAEFLRRGGVNENDVFSSRLVSCELISNVIIHSGETAIFKGEICGGEISITVTASGLDAVNLNPELPSVFAESGRGMYIVNSICLGNVERLGGGLKATIKRNLK